MLKCAAAKEASLDPAAWHRGAGPASRTIFPLPFFRSKGCEREREVEGGGLCLVPPRGEVVEVCVEVVVVAQRAFLSNP